MRIRRNSIVILAVILATLVVVQVLAAVQAPAGQQGGPAAGARGAGGGGGAAAPGQGGGRGGGGGGQRGGRGGAQAAATPAGPAPRLPNGKPDLSGHWTNPYTPNMAGRGSVLDPTKKRADGTCCEPLTFDHQGEAIAESKGTPKTFDLPYTDWGRKKWAEYDPVANGDYAGSCLPFGWSRNINSPHGVQLIQNNDALAMLFEQNTWHTWIPTMESFKWPADLPRTWNGSSIGRWEGDTLIVETTKLVEQVDQRYPHSDSAQVVERYQLTKGARGERVLVIDMTMTDPVFYARPVSGQKKWVEVPDGHLLPYDCAEEGWRKRLEQLERGAEAQRTKTQN